MPVTFQASVHRYTTDSQGEARLTITIPRSDRHAGVEAAQLTEQTVIVTICTEEEVKEAS